MYKVYNFNIFYQYLKMVCHMLLLIKYNLFRIVVLKRYFSPIKLFSIRRAHNSYGCCTGTFKKPPWLTEKKTLNYYFNLKRLAFLYLFQPFIKSIIFYCSKSVLSILLIILIALSIKFIMHAEHIICYPKLPSFLMIRANFLLEIVYKDSNKRKKRILL